MDLLLGLGVGLTMKTTIRDCMTLPSFEKAEVVAGKNGIDRVVKKISVLEASCIRDLEDFSPEKDEMLVTGFFGIRDNVEAQCQVVQLLAEKGLAALVIYKVGDVVKVVDQSLIDLCDQLGLVLIAISNGSTVKLSDILEDVSHILFYGTAEKYGNRLITESIFYLLNFDKYNDFPSAVSAAAKNNKFQFVLLSDDFHPVLVVENRHQTTVERAIRVGRDREMDKKAAVCTMVDVDGTLTYWGPVNIQNKLYYMFIVDNEDFYSKDEIIKLANIIDLSMGMWKYTPVDDQHAEFVKALRRGNMRLAYYIKEEIGLDEKAILSVFMCKGDNFGDAYKFIEDYTSERNLKFICIIDGEEIYGIIIGDATQTEVNKLYDQVVEKTGVYMFYVSGVDGIEGACESFKLINETWYSATKVFPRRKGFSKYELVMISNCNNIQEQGGSIKRNYIKLLEAFDEESSKKGRQLINTLETFVLDAGLNGIRTSEIMEVHINTVQYRLKKISEILGIEISVNRLVPGVTIALALKRLDRDEIGK